LTVVYLDSNAFAKLYLDDEDDQDQVVNSVQEYGRVASCAITYAEVAGVFARAFHEGRLTQESYEEAMVAFSEDWSSTKVYDVTPELSAIAAMLMKGHPGLRAMDALHLASALAQRRSTPIQFLTFDQRLNAVSRNLIPDAF